LVPKPKNIYWNEREDCPCGELRQHSKLLLLTAVQKVFSSFQIELFLFIVCLFIFEVGSCHIAQAELELGIFSLLSAGMASGCIVLAVVLNSWF
jgi:hypothetical protein